MTEDTDRINEARPRRFSRYPEYKDSGIAWLGEIPKDWEVGRLKDHGAFVGGAGFPHDYQGSDNEVLPFYKVGDLSTSSEGRYMGQAPNTVSLEIAAELRAHVIPVDSIIYAKIGAALLLNRRRITTMPCCIDNNMSAYVPRRGALASEWAFHCTTIVDFAALANPGAVPSLSEGDQADIPFVIPPMSEQRAIAAFLDRETAKIDGLVARKERLIKLLQEKRAALISRAVTRGIDPNVPMKDSGVEWLGEIPAHWNVVRSKMLFTHRKESALPDDQQLTASQQYGVIPQSKFMELEGRSVVQVITGADILKHVEPKDFVISMRSFQGGLEHSKYRGCISSAYVMVRPSDQVDGGYFSYAFKSATYVQALQSTSDLVRDGQALRFANFVQVPLPLVPLQEQKAIATQLNKKVTQLDRLGEATVRAISHLKEFRTALISAAVTGKIDVREESS